MQKKNMNKRAFHSESIEANKQMGQEKIDKYVEKMWRMETWKEKARNVRNVWLSEMQFIDAYIQNSDNSCFYKTFFIIAKAESRNYLRLSFRFSSYDAFL